MFSTFYPSKIISIVKSVQLSKAVSLIFKMILVFLFQLIVAVTNDEVLRLEDLYKRGIRNGAKGLTFLSKSEIKEVEPYCQVFIHQLKEMFLIFCVAHFIFPCS